MSDSETLEARREREVSFTHADNLDTVPSTLFGSSGVSVAAQHETRLPRKRSAFPRLRVGIRVIDDNDRSQVSHLVVSGVSEHFAAEMVAERACWGPRFESL